MNTRILISIVFLFLFSCEKEEVSFNDYSSEINFDVSDWILKDKDISCVEFDRDGNAWIASGNEMIIYNNGKIKIYDANAKILDLAIAPNRDVWLGTTEGLARFKDKKFEFYNEENSTIPRNYIHDVEVTSDGRVWFCSTAGDLGGLICFNGKSFKLFNPENSIINQHVIQNARADNNNNLYFNTYGQVGKAKMYKYNGQNNKLEKLGGDESLYWISALDVDSKGEVYFSVDYSLSSSLPHNNFIGSIYKNEWNSFGVGFDLSYQFCVDKRDYLWGCCVIGDFRLLVFDGKEWHTSESGQIPEYYIRDINADFNNNMWVCTEKGIYILNQ
jgi:ligand-binding sensor domain-containing protein